ncbi:MAG: fatty acid desaturase family protein [Methyloceanibacter sp.]|uniref:fatty acid desaturase family protein n=1 Tax=Methyloceanibacter sp. TaxID=1965321 RepID=UPI003D6CD729
MPDVARIKRVIAYLREEIPVDDISINPVVEHPHNTSRMVPERLPAATIKELSRLEPAKAIAATAAQWVVIAAAIALCVYVWHPIVYVLAVIFIGSRQHALLILGHDASHYRILPTRWQNDLFANVLMMWPTFASVEGFRKFHGTHHQYTGLQNDGNRHIWYTHDAAGELAPDWQFPKTRLGLALVLLRRAAFVTGLFWIVRGLVGSTLIPSPAWMRAARFTFYACAAVALTVFGGWYAFLLYWIVPFCTWHIAAQYIRLICEHSAVESEEEEYAITRTTVPTWLESIFILPCNVGYHLEHHWYPSVPFYRLPELHQALMEREGFRQHAVVRRSVLTSLGECVREAAAQSRAESRAQA